MGNPNMFITGKMPVQGQYDYGKDETFALHAKQTRLNSELRSPTPIGSLKIYYENDFFNTESSMDYRLVERLISLLSRSRALTANKTKN